MVPTTTDELDKIEDMFSSTSRNKNTTEVKISNVSINTQINTTSEGMKENINNQINLSTQNNDIPNNDISNNNTINITQTILIDESHVSPNNEIQKENTNNNTIYENEIVRKTDNPYEIPEDF